jgi:hypothetical protein
MKDKHTEHNVTHTAVATPAPRLLSNIWALPRSIAIDWAYPALDKRDLRLDLLRGFAVVVMVVDHFGGSSWLYWITGGNSFFVSGAEAFIFISGLVVGMVYGAVALKQGIRSAQIKALQRAFTLYKLNFALTLLFAALSIQFGLDWAKDSKVGNPLAFAFDVATLRRTMYLTDIPLLYTFLMFAAAGALWLLYKGRAAWLLAGSFALWAAFQVAPEQVAVPWPIAGSTIFHLAAWQFLFVVAMVLGYHRQALAKRLSQIPRLPYLLLSGLLLVWLVQLYNTNGAFLGQAILGIDTHVFMSQFFLKSALAPGRLIASFIVFQFAYLAATLFWKPIWTGLGWLLLPLGQNSLYSNTMHVVVIGLFYTLLPHLPGHILEMGTLNTAVQLMFVLLLWAMIQRQFLFKVVPR